MVTGTEIISHYAKTIYHCPDATPLYAISTERLKSVSCQECRARSNMEVIVPDCTFCGMTHRIALWLLNDGDVIEVFDLSDYHADVYEPGNCYNWDAAFETMRRICYWWRALLKGFSTPPDLYLERPTFKTLRALPELRPLLP